MSAVSIIEPPGWALSLVGGPEATTAPWTSEGGVRIRTVKGTGSASGCRATLLSAVRDDATDLDADAFREASADLYERLYTRFAEGPLRPVRLWNVIPRIVEPLGELPHRYMAFNAGRHEAFLRHYGSPEELAAGAPTATGVGSFGRSLVIHALAMTEPTRPFENPRQTPARCYSNRYGPHPPCFARASRLERSSEPWLLIGGTASVVGEESLHVGDLDAQLDETVENLRALLQASGAEGATPKSLRVYFASAAEEAPLRARVQDALGPCEELEMIHAELCRPELLVEIEGVYRYPVAGETTAAL